MSNLHSPKTNYFGNHIHHVMTKDSNQKSIKKLSHVCRLSFKFMLKYFKSKILDNPLQIFKNKQRLCSTNLHPPFFQNKGFI